MFRRTKSDTTSATVPAEPQAKAGGKGRPTPSRKEAEAARKAAYKKPRNRKEASALRREKMAAERAKMQSALQTGDDRYLPAADKGPVRRFARDYVDARFSVMEFALPILLVVSLVGVVFSRQYPWLAGLVNIFFLIMVLFIFGDWFLLSGGLKKAVAKRHPGEPTKGIGFYAVRRTMQMRRWRLPKPMVKRGERPN
ncbi:DUF3043 domain-containing protein [Kribbella antibiotica]|uniref:DUF3043 domain-containing protein n=1 Tax=Kribbella antibiotica TaxID=190195 RepID=A0A4R4ZPX6_9ACTN|nr:DUF3043 domain-containing protein [Kribbella antibiotica]TDD60765.1 DUF3043 domain-containing protein [Kribbella antibiotica]